MRISLERVCFASKISIDARTTNDEEPSMTLSRDPHSDWPAVSELLDEALALPAAELDTWLDSLAGERLAYKDELRTLLALRTFVDREKFLVELPKLHDAPAFQTATLGAPELTAGAVVGRYRLVSELGRGGMSTVWLAEHVDGRFRRRVALKLPRVAWDGSFTERLHRERHILESLEHPNIARFLDAGVDDAGRPHLVLEYVDGQCIDAYCAQHSLGVRERLELVLQVCQAVAHAHTQLVIHRDLKPANILVTAQGQVKLLDFGIAKLMTGDRASETSITMRSGRALTLDYASPEQIRGEPLGTASDVYSLGVVAFELLTGARPYRLKRGTAAELEDAIAHADAPRASTVATGPQSTKALRGDLDAILDKVLRKTAADRYPTIESFADDLTRHLGHVPVRARAPGRWYLMRRYAARHRTGVAAAAVTLLALTTALGVSLWQADAAARSERTARQALVREQSVQTMLLETLAVAVTADPVKLREPDGFGLLLQAKFDEFEKRFSAHPEQWLDLLQLMSEKLPAYGDQECSLALGLRYVALLEKTEPVDSARLMRAYAGNARGFQRLGHRTGAVKMLRLAMGIRATDPTTAALRTQLEAELRQLGGAVEGSGS